MKNFHNKKTFTKTFAFEDFKKLTRLDILKRLEDNNGDKEENKEEQ